MTVAVTGGVIGSANVNRVTDDQEFALGTTVIGADGDPYVYVQASGAIAASQTDISVDAAFQASDGLGAFQNGSVAWADNQYGWVRDGTRLVT